MSKQTLFYRILLLVLCAIIAIVCFLHLNQSYDPLARYPYATEKNRNVILKYLDSQDIDYMINQHLRPKYYMDFIKVKGFDIHKTMYYYTAKKTQTESDEYIVNFINKYNKYFDRDGLEEILKNYSYMDLTAFYENDKTNNASLQLAANPGNPFLILNKETTVYKYTPEDITAYNNIFVKSIMVDDLQDMQQAYAKMMVNETMQIESGYATYDSLSQYYGELENTYSKKQLQQFVLPAGQNEAQLGYTIYLEGNKEWMTNCLQNIENNEINYENVMNAMSDAQKDLIVWLEENAYHYGFVIRYPENGTEQTKMAYQPFVLRYVGKDAARKMMQSKETMEETDFSDMEM